MTNIFNKSGSDKFFGNLAFPRMQTVPVEDHQLEAMRGSRVFQAWVDSGAVEITDEAVEDMDRDEFILHMMDDPDAQKTTDSDPRPTTSWINARLIGGMAPVTADERDALWASKSEG